MQRQMLAIALLAITILLFVGWLFSTPATATNVAAPERSEPAPTRRSFESNRPQAEAPRARPEPAQRTGTTEWTTASTVSAFVAYGTDVSPFQDHVTAVELLCDADRMEAAADLDAWVDTVLWDSRARGGWAVARRAKGAERARIVGLLARNAGIESCALQQRLEADVGTRFELPVAHPSHGSPQGVAANDAKFIRELERGFID